MSITDELREYALGWDERNRVRRDLRAIADRIDAEHEKAMSRAGQLLADAEKDRDYNYANWQDCKQKVLQHNITMGELSAEIERLKDELAHCIELPLDVDGVPWNVGDRDEGGNEVIALKLAPDGWYVVTVGEWPYRPEHKRHHHAPTVEDVLRDVVTLCHNTWKEGSAFEFYDVDDVMKSGNIAEYAARLRLAGSDAE